MSTVFFVFSSRVDVQWLLSVTRTIRGNDCCGQCPSLPPLIYDARKVWSQFFFSLVIVLGSGGNSVGGLSLVT